MERPTNGNAKDYEAYREEKLEQGRVFQDVVTKALYQRGIVVVGYASRQFQHNVANHLGSLLSLAQIPTEHGECIALL
jgi:predicted HTH domain antitoxin